MQHALLLPLLLRWLLLLLLRPLRHRLRPSLRLRRSRSCAAQHIFHCLERKFLRAIPHLLLLLLLLRLRSRLITTT